MEKYMLLCIIFYIYWQKPKYSLSHTYVYSIICAWWAVSQMYPLKFAFKCWKHFLIAHFAKNIVCAKELGRFWESTDISVLTPKTAPQPLATQSTILLYYYTINEMQHIYLLW